MARSGSVSPWVWGGVGCCLGCVVLPIAFVAVLGALGFGVMGAVGNADVVDVALERAAAEPRVVAALGEPLEKGWLVQGSIEMTGASGRADVAVPVKGSKGEGTLYVAAEKRAGVWEYEVIAVEVEATGERIQVPLVVEAPPPGAI